MKRITIDEKCNNCGICALNNSYIEENEAGDISVVKGKFISDADLEDINKLIRSCPVKALNLVESSICDAKNKRSIPEVINDLQKKCDAFKIPDVKPEQIPFDVDKYGLDFRAWSTKEGRYAYSSESAARSAARQEFNSLCYSENIYKPALRKLFVQYKMDALRPYYTEEKDGIFYTYSKQVEEMLADTYLQIAEISGGGSKVPESWKEFSVSLSKDNLCVLTLQIFEERSTESGIITEFKDSGEYTSLSWYVDRMDFDYTERYEGSGLFGRDKYKKEWCFHGFMDAAKEYTNDMKTAIGYRKSYIEELAASQINDLLHEFEKEIKKEWNKKIEELKASCTL